MTEIEELRLDFEGHYKASRLHPEGSTLPRSGHNKDLYADWTTQAAWVDFMAGYNSPRPIYTEQDLDNQKESPESLKEEIQRNLETDADWLLASQNEAAMTEMIRGLLPWYEPTVTPVAAFQRDNQVCEGRR